MKPTIKSKVFDRLESLNKPVIRYRDIAIAINEVRGVPQYGTSIGMYSEVLYGNNPYFLKPGINDSRHLKQIGYGQYQLVK